jgi:hypothetical protein
VKSHVRHIGLLGDSIFDNAAYVGREPDVITHLRALLPPGWQAAHALALFAERVQRFEAAYRGTIDAAAVLGRPVTVCTIYNGNVSAIEAVPARTGLTLFNDVILRVAFERALSVIDLRLVCNEPADYANPIEPSGRGGRKIAEAMRARLFGGGGARQLGDGRLIPDRMNTYWLES